MSKPESVEKNYTEMSSRSVIDVANQILVIIPDKEYMLKKEIVKYCESISNKAPEILRGSICWIPFVNILNIHVSVFDEEWKIRARNIINNVPE
uniref:Uncharacterized protein n=1 Tax=viral metagenome TaxID=1070528 RepID=A0A6C0HGM2_9ZZZZ